MPNFSSVPPSDVRHPGYRLVRTPSNRPLRGIVLSENMVGCPTHYVSNRTVPCERPNCDACQNGIGWRWHGYVLTLLDPTNESVIFECTATAAENFANYHKRYGTTRGCFFQATRLNGKTNGRVIIQTKPADLTKVTLPKPQDLVKLLCHIWNVAPNQAEQADSMNKPPHGNIVLDRTRPEMVPPEPTYQDLSDIPTVGELLKANGRKPKIHVE